ncbi:MAG: adenylate kinase [Arsenophonus endosymbiont of Ceratovacuna japonica]
MRIILLGAPGSGKGTQAQFIMNKYNIPQISIGNMLRATAKECTKLGLKVKELMNKGKFVSDELVINLVKNSISHSSYRNGFLLDGFPRNILQADAIKNSDIMIDYILEFNVPDEIIIDRIIGRRVHMSSGRVYHIKFNPPKIENKDDITGEELIIRNDDKEKIIRQRLIEYHKLTKLLIIYYNQKISNTYTKYFKLDGTRQITEINKELTKILG